MTDRGVAQCSGSGTVNAVGRLALQAGPGQSSGAAGPAAVASALPAGPEAAELGGWSHVELELEQGKAARLAKAVEEAIEQAAEAHEQAALARAGAAAGGAAGDAKAVAQGAEGAGQQQAAIKWATQAARDEEQLAAENQAIQPQQQPALPLPAGLQEPVGAAPTAAGTELAATSGEVVLTMPDGAAPSEDGPLVQQATILRLSYRVMREPPSAARVAAPEAAPLRRAKPSLLRMLSRRPAKFAAARLAPDARKAGEQPAMSAEEVTAGLHLEVPVDPLPQHLHAYGHGGGSCCAPLLRPACCQTRAWDAAAASSAACHVPCGSDILFSVLSCRHACPAWGARPGVLTARQGSAWGGLTFPTAPLCHSPTAPLPHCPTAACTAFMGAALSMGLNLQWRQILQREDPEAYKRASK